MTTCNPRTITPRHALRLARAADLAKEKRRGPIMSSVRYKLTSTNRSGLWAGIRLRRFANDNGIHRMERAIGPRDQGQIMALYVFKERKEREQSHPINRNSRKLGCVQSLASSRLYKRAVKSIGVSRAFSCLDAVCTLPPGLSPIDRAPLYTEAGHLLVYGLSNRQAHLAGCASSAGLASWKGSSLAASSFYWTVTTG